MNRTSIECSSSELLFHDTRLLLKVHCSWQWHTDPTTTPHTLILNPWSAGFYRFLVNSLQHGLHALLTSSSVQTIDVFPAGGYVTLMMTVGMVLMNNTALMVCNIYYWLYPLLPKVLVFLSQFPSELYILYTVNVTLKGY